MHYRTVLAALLIGIPAAADATDVATFLAKVEAVESKGPLAMFSEDLKQLTNETSQAMATLKKERLAAEASGGHGAYCPQDKATLSQGEMVAALKAIPAAARPHVQVKDALKAALARKYPCRVH